MHPRQLTRAGADASGRHEYGALLRPREIARLSSRLNAGYPCPWTGTRRAILTVAIAAIVTFAAVFTRALQVAIFAVAAGLRRLTAKQHTPTGAFVAAAPASMKAAEPLAVQNGKGLIAYHPVYDRYDSERVRQALREAAALGATYLRVDIYWRDIMPAPGEINASALEWYAGFFRTARDRFGFTPLVVFSNPARSVITLPVEKRLEAWKQYVSTVLRSLHGSCRHFQLLNEPNNPVFQFFPVRMTAAALRTAATVIRTEVPAARLSVNFLIDIWPWRSQLEELLSDAPEAIDTVGIDAYPDTWAIGLRNGFDDLSALPQTLRAELRGLRSAHTLAIMETGYSTNVPLVRDGKAQATYFQKLRRSVGELRKLEFVGIYELTDENSDAKPDPEANFGLLDSRLRRKEAFAEAQRLFSELND